MAITRYEKNSELLSWKLPVLWIWISHKKMHEGDQGWWWIIYLSSAHVNMKIELEVVMCCSSRCHHLPMFNKCSPKIPAHRSIMHFMANKHVFLVQLSTRMSADCFQPDMVLPSYIEISFIHISYFLPIIQDKTA